MKEERPPSAPLQLSIAALVAVLMTAYVAGYFVLDCRGWIVQGYVIRDYQSEWQAAIYWPAGRVEEAFCGSPVLILSDKYCPGTEQSKSSDESSED
jgi:hypothetical protein